MEVIAYIYEGEGVPENAREFINGIQHYLLEPSNEFFLFKRNFKT